MSEETTQDRGGLSRGRLSQAHWRSGRRRCARGAARRRRRGPALDPARATRRRRSTSAIVSPLTGPDAGFGEPDPYVVGLARAAFAKGLKVGGKTYAVKIIEKDSQSGPAVARTGRAAS